MNNASIEWVFALFIIFQVKHFLADFVFQNMYMLRKAQAGWDFFVPLCIHSLIHAAFTALIVMFVDPSKWFLVPFDFAVHFITDRLKSGPRYFGRFNNPKSQIYWILFGLDQMVHHLTHICICWILIQS